MRRGGAYRYQYNQLQWLKGSVGFVVGCMRRKNGHGGRTFENGARLGIGVSGVGSRARARGGGDRANFFAVKVLKSANKRKR